jgi:uracil-DNA glycosylase
MGIQMEAGWQAALEQELHSFYFANLQDFVTKERKEKVVFPPERFVYEAFNKTPFDQVKVVLIGQDPYHGAGQAHGLSFSVPADVKLPPSLRNIYKELRDDLGIAPALFGDLSQWAEQGVLLLNATLTVREGEAGSHQNKGWEQFTDAVIRILSERKTGLVFLLWGNYAQKKTALIDASKHHILCSAHPSPLSAHQGFLGNKHFSKTNALLAKSGKTPIDWQLE